jgi:hypothetical protein
MHVSPSFFCASVWSRSCLLPDLCACVRRQVVGFNCLSSLPSCLKQKKNCTFCFACSRNDGVVTGV